MADVKPFTGEEKLAEQIHQVYCRYYKDRHGEDYWTKGDYSKLDDATKEADRYVARFIQTIITADRKRIEELGKFVDLQQDRIEKLEGIEFDQTAEIERLRGALRDRPTINPDCQACRRTGQVIKEVLDGVIPQENTRPIMPDSKVCKCGEAIHQEVMEYRLRCEGCNMVYRRAPTEGGTLAQGKEDKK